MENNYDSQVIYCNFCNKPIFPFDARTIDLETSNRYCNTYCCEMGRKRNLERD